jgi:pyrroline-5-carboxylate reductase
MASVLVGYDAAYILPFVEALVDACVRIGLPRDVAWKSAIWTILNSTPTVERADEHPADLRNRVTSPGEQ